MTTPFISSVFDYVGPRTISVEAASRILANAMAPELGLQCPHDLAKRVLFFFRTILGEYRSGSQPRGEAEAAITEIFNLAARRDYVGMLERATPF